MQVSVRSFNPSRLTPSLLRRSVLIPVAYALALFIVSPIHSTFDEWGGVMQYFAGREILDGAGYDGWVSHFWPPLFSLLIGLGSFVMPGFAAGKAISIIAAAILLYVASRLALELTGRQDVAVWTQLFLALSPMFVLQSLLAHNHMLDALLFITGLWLFLRSLRKPSPRKLLIVGLVTGLAGLARFTSYVFLALPCSLYLSSGQGFWKATKLALAFWTGFALISLPWWYSNAAANGSPFYTWEYLNICTAVLPGQQAGSLSSLWWCSGQSSLDSIPSIVAANPIGYLVHFVHNLVDSAKLLVTYGGVLAPFVIPAVFDSLLILEQKTWFIVFGTLFLYVLAVAQAFVASWFLLCWMALIIILTVSFVVRYVGRIQEKYLLLNKRHFQNVLLAVLLTGGLALTSIRLATYERSANAGLADLDQVTQALKAHDRDLQSKTIMAIDPARAYYAGANYLATPLDYDGPVEGMVSYSGIDERQRTYAPKYPAKMQLSALRADYLIYTKPLGNWTEPRDLPQYSFLLDPESDKIPNSFRLVYRSPEVVVYEIDWHFASMSENTEP